MPDRFSVKEAFAFDPGWYAEVASGFALQYQRSLNASFIGAGIIMVGPRFQESTRGSILNLPEAERMAEDWWGRGYPDQDPQWRDRLAGLVLHEVAAGPDHNGWFDIGYFTVAVDVRDGEKPTSTGWLQVLGGEIYAWQSRGAATCWNPKWQVGLTADREQAVEEIFPPGLSI